MGKYDTKSQNPERKCQKPELMSIYEIKKSIFFDKKVKTLGWEVEILK